VGLAVVEDGHIVKRTHQLLRPHPPIFDPFNISIHGITADDVAEAPSFEDYWPILWASIQGPLVAHNAAFDMSCIRHALDQCELPYPKTDYYCTRVLSRLAWPHYPTYALDHIAQTLGIVFQHHNAAEDAATCAQVFLTICRQLQVEDLTDLHDMLGVRAGKLFRDGYYPCRGPYISRFYKNEQVRSVADTYPSNRTQDENHPFFGKVLVFTGTMSSMTRRQAMQAVVACGGLCGDIVNAQTDYLILGQKGYWGYQAGHKSNKMRKAESMRNKGAAIEIMSETDFLSLL
jgi:DNA polymerase-3 subunit epsilon